MIFTIGDARQAVAAGQKAIGEKCGSEEESPYRMIFRLGLPRTSLELIVTRMNEAVASRQFSERPTERDIRSLVGEVL